MEKTGKMTYGGTESQTDFRHLPDTMRRSAAERKYARAVAMYAATDLPLCRVAGECGVTVAGLSAHIARHHRDLLFRRYGLDAEQYGLHTVKVKAPKGQSLKTYIKYKDAVRACGDIAYIEFNVSQIARMFGLNATSLSSQLKVHYPDIIPCREEMRRKLGVADNVRRGPRERSALVYGDALEMYRDTDLTLPEVSEICGVSRGGLNQYMRFHHQDIVNRRAERRDAARIGRKASRSLNLPRRRSSSLRAEAKYAPAIESLRDNPRAVAVVASEFGLNPEVFRSYLQKHAPALAAGQGMSRRDDGKLIKRSASEKYEGAIREFASSADTLKSIAARHGLVYSSLKRYIIRNCPEERERHRSMVAAVNKI